MNESNQDSCLGESQAVAKHSDTHLIAKLFKCSKCDFQSLFEETQNIKQLQCYLQVSDKFCKAPKE